MDDIRREVHEVEIRLLDDAYMAWSAAEAESELSLDAWFDGAGAKRTNGYFAYLAALDREDAAARDLQRLTELTQPAA
jgi:hypothetical protein